MLCNINLVAKWRQLVINWWQKDLKVLKNKGKIILACVVWFNYYVYQNTPYEWS